MLFSRFFQKVDGASKQTCIAEETRPSLDCHESLRKIF